MSKQVERCSGMSLRISGPPVPAGRGGAPWKKKRKSSATAGKRPRATKAKKTGA